MPETQRGIYFPDTLLIYPEPKIFYPEPVRDLLRDFNTHYFKDKNIIPQHPRYYLIGGKFQEHATNGHSQKTNEGLWLITEGIGNICVPFSEVPPDLLGNIPGYVFKMVFRTINTREEEPRARADFLLTRTQRAIREIRDTAFEHPYFANHVVE